MEITLSDAQLEQLAKQIEGHPCRFNGETAHNLHRLSDSLATPEAWECWNAVLSFGATLIQVRKAGVVATVTLTVGAMLAAMWAAIRAAISRG